MYAQENGYHIVEWFVDFGKSGTTFDQRPEFQRMRSRVENDPRFESVICYDESRWGRAIDPEENTYMRVLFRKRNVDVVLVKTSVDRNNEFAPMLSAFEGVQASQYSKKLSELTLRGAKNNSIYSTEELHHMDTEDVLLTPRQVPKGYPSKANGALPVRKRFSGS